MSTKLQAIIDFVFHGQGVAQAASALGKLGQMGRDMGQAWSDIATPINQSIEIFQKVGQAAQQAYQYIGEGADLAASREKFDALSGSINTTGDALLGKLKEATRGTVSDFKLIESASGLMNLKLVETQEEAVRMGAVAGKLNWDMSVLALTIANQSTMRLDNLGLSMQDVTSRANALEKQGLATDEAFKFAIIEAGEAKLLLVGDAADRAAGKLKILETNATNAGDNFKASFSEELINQLNDVAGGLFETADGASSAGAAIGTELAKGITDVFVKMNPVKWLMDYNVGFLKLIGVIDDTTDAHDRGREAMVQFNQMIAANNAIIDRGAGLYDDRREAINSHNDAMREARQYTYEQTDAAAEFDDKLIQSTFHLSEQEAAILRANIAAGVYSDTTTAVTGAIYASAEAIAAHNAATGDFATMAIQAGDEGVNLNQVMYDSLDAAGGSAEALVGLALATGQLTEAQAENILKQAAMIEYAQGLGEAIAAGTIEISDAVAALGNFQAGLETSNVLVNGATGSVLLMNDAVIGSSSAVGGLQTSLNEFTTSNAVGATQAFIDKLDSIPRTIDVQVNVHGDDVTVPPSSRGDDFIVPPSSRVGDFTVLPSSRERVQDTPAGRSGGGNTYNLYVTAMDGGANVTREFSYMMAIMGA